MIMNSYGDMAQHLFLRNRSVGLKNDISTLTQELSSGKTSQLTQKLGGDLTYLSDVERNLDRLKSFQVANTEAALFASSMQNNIELISDNVVKLTGDIFAVTTSPNDETSQQLSNQAEVYLTEAIRSLNGETAGRSLFSGKDTEAQPLADLNTLMSSLVTEVTPFTTAPDIVQAVKDWFADPLGFDTVMYQGASDLMDPVKIGPTEEVTVSLKANDDAFKQTLQSLAIATLVNDPGLSLTSDVKFEMLRSTGVELRESQVQLIQMQSDLGFVEGRIEETATRNGAAQTSLSLVFNELVQADPYETSTRLDEAQFQLESLFTVTARTSQLSLMRFLS
ncbi:flagellin [Phaeobacter inhibens]|uniref:flagellin n=1 Tax=Phaeobacter inhibens TaxID=221822 RepID=UPI00076BB31E|nr:flagellin [Phaeobacter inhibens]KXF88632.1 flagellar biosynthesis protein FlgL [Phaeobacter inhibens]WHP68527.1 flagellin [Phaeobacter inhibens]